MGEASPATTTSPTGCLSGTWKQSHGESGHMGMIKDFSISIPHCALRKDIITKFQPDGIWETIVTEKQKDGRCSAVPQKRRGKQERIKCGKCEAEPGRGPTQKGDYHTNFNRPLYYLGETSEPVQELIRQKIP